MSLRSEIAEQPAAVARLLAAGAAPDVSAVIAAARRDGALTIAITNRASSALARAAEHIFELRCGPERAIAATKTYTTSCVALAMLAGSAAGRPLEFADLPDAMREAVDSEPDAARIARKIGSARALVRLGRGCGYAAALAAQHVAAHVARRHGRDPEKPAGLSKVTRTL